MVSRSRQSPGRHSDRSNSRSNPKARAALSAHEPAAFVSVNKVAAIAIAWTAAFVTTVPGQTVRSARLSGGTRCFAFATARSVDTS
jgi:hypothetical protein